MTNYLAIQDQLPDIHGGKSSRDRHLQLRNPLREKDRHQPRVDSASKHNSSQIAEVPSNRAVKDQSSARDKLAYILGRPHMVKDSNRYNLDNYISIEQNGEYSRELVNKASSYDRVADDYPSYRKNDEVSRIRLNHEGIRAQSSKKLPNIPIQKAKYKEYSLQPKYNAHSRYLMHKEIDKQRAALALDPYKQYPGKPTPREPSAIEARVLRGVKMQGSEPERYRANRAQVIKRPEYYQKMKEAPFIYQQPEWWG